MCYSLLQVEVLQRAGVKNKALKDHTTYIINTATVKLRRKQV